ncbi:MAG: hypothetical protein JO293_02660 [Candidatus Eremiobacteraeota bacterium]|nr:hypothetical protein [Candidatus Eremiobacteraeota bacterium]MBV8222236.1 hypothetical protein [Candidatus Eremiobacteraeota bacterium]
MDVVIVGGPHSGVGKTFAAEIALRALAGRGYGAIKLTVADGERDPEHDHGSSALAVAGAAGICGRGMSCGVCETVSAKTPSRLITAHGAIHKPGTDTWRLASAGATAVAWIITLREAAPAAVEEAMAHLASRGARGVVIEGTTALDWIDPRVSVMVATDPGRRWKEVALRNVGRCSIVLRATPPLPSGDVPAPPEFAAASPVFCDFGEALDPGTHWYEARVRELAA